MEGLEMNSIKSKLIRSISTVLFITIVFLNILLVGFVKRYYYENTEELLKSQIEVSVRLYNKYFSLNSLKENIYDNVDAFWNNSNSQVEIFDENGSLIMDSMGVKDEKLLEGEDVKKALNGDVSRWVGKVNYYNSKVMAVSSPLKNGDEIIGVIRFITSLEAVNSIITNIIVFLVTISLIVLIIGVVMSILIANSIITPIKSLTKVAEKMANGDLTIRSDINGDNEVSKLANTFNFMANEIEKREQLKNGFISSVSHELRTPLTAIKGWAITLNSDETDKETLNIGFEIIEKEVDRLTTMVEELLDFSRIINDKVSLNISYIDAEIFINNIESLMKPRAIKEKLNFQVNYSKDLGKIYIDSNRIKQVLINILDNSFKFTEENGLIRLKVIKNDTNVVFIVEDNGCGIAQDDLPKVKEKFFKGENSKSQNGIGLSICDEIIKLHNGTFNIYSEIGIGTKVEVIIPLDRRG